MSVAGRSEGKAPYVDARIAGILERIRAIPRGSVATYGEIDRRAPRLVGRVLSTIDADLPWYRVVRADGSVAMGARQLRLLRREGIPLHGNRVDLSSARRGARPAQPATTPRARSM